MSTGTQDANERTEALNLAFKAGWATEYYDTETELELPGVPDGEGNDCTDDFIKLIKLARIGYAKILPPRTRSELVIDDD